MVKKFKNKINSFKKPPVIAVALLFAAVMTYLLASSFAAKGPATLYTSPGGNKSVAIDTNFVINVRVSTASDVPVTGAVATLAYPTDKLQVSSVAYDGSPYNIQLVQTNSGGVLRMERAALPAIPGGDQLFAKVTFRALAAGNASVSFNSDSKVISGEDDSNMLSTRSGVNIEILNPTPAPTPPPTSPTPTPSPGPSPTPTPSPAPAPTPSPSSPTNSPTSPPSAPTAATTQPQQPVQQPAVVIPDTLPSVDKAGVPPALRISVIDQDKNLVKGAKVTIDGKTQETNNKGIAEFSKITGTIKEISVTYKGKTTKQTVDVSSVLGAADGRAISLPINAKNSTNMLPIIALPLLLALAGGLIIFGRKYLPGLNRTSVYAHVPGVKTNNVTTGLPVVPQPPQDNPLDQIPYPEPPKPGNTVSPKDPKDDPNSL